jgi:hypothetical protein
VTDNGRIAMSDGHDFPGLIDQGVPGVTAVIDDVVERFEDAVRQPVLTHELPDVFLAVELGACRGDNGRSEMLLGTCRSFCAMSADLIEKENGVAAGG